jgi:hypothetical protein
MEAWIVPTASQYVQKTNQHLHKSVFYKLSAYLL